MADITQMVPMSSLDIMVRVAGIVGFLTLGACTGWLTLRSLPAGLEARQKRLETIVAGYKTDLAAIADERTAWRVQGERLAEEVSTLLDQVERKRSSTAASASRIKAAAEPEPVSPENMSRADQILWARHMAG